ncbi:esterase-like activity of phytase family protein [Leptolyngbya sp. FACHB-261]|uniref:esterase-like activity of phytase family protein n=1 Tax=Leptolyngbya sp. FACHB-261 TaxID=2692806 RepID=UPI001687C3EC|nr:esterase-like activity of phytase family protein [Leptolyngbya sp. FACHB-261]MBD2104142.1 esterase-like activity of phytase family protein [Leptolyngbya sp. FACHB-261]
MKAAPIVERLEFMGRYEFPTTQQVQGTAFGGISGLAYAPSTQRFYGVSDDPHRSRLYQLSLDYSSAGFSAARVEAVVPLSVDLDGEGIALSGPDTVWISSETAPYLNAFDRRTGKLLRSLRLPDAFTPGQSRGLRNNRAFESLTLTPDGQRLYVATEQALQQDGPSSDLQQGSRCRIVEFDLRTGQATRQFVYQTEPVPSPSNPFFNENGLVDLLALDNDGHFLALERSVSGVGFGAKLFEVSLGNAEDVTARTSLSGQAVGSVQKTLLLNLNTLAGAENFILDNLEGMSFGPSQADGSRSLVLISDDNFSRPLPQRTQVLALRLVLASGPRRP